jgi:acyl-CoA thioesterase FadM
VVAVVTVLLLKDEMKVEVVFAFKAFKVARIELGRLVTAGHVWNLTYLTKYEYSRTSFLDLYREFGVQVACHPRNGHACPVLYYRPLFVEKACSIEQVKALEEIVV